MSNYTDLSKLHIKRSFNYNTNKLDDYERLFIYELDKHKEYEKSATAKQIVEIFIQGIQPVHLQKRITALDPVSVDAAFQALYNERIKFDVAEAVEQDKKKAIQSMNNDFKNEYVQTSINLTTIGRLHTKSTYHSNSINNINCEACNRPGHTYKTCKFMCRTCPRTISPHVFRKKGCLQHDPNWKPSKDTKKFDKKYYKPVTARKAEQRPSFETFTADELAAAWLSKKLSDVVPACKVDVNSRTLIDSGADISITSICDATIISPLPNSTESP
mmetsp:Transcript_20243/g.20353  ORF Transcript_20243/g.20353 Transcript_20243/m.20353 type:complete len:273 (-) Transcript_20243:125-943(-)